MWVVAFFFLATHICMWDLSSLTRDQSNLLSLHLKCRVTITEQPEKTLIMVLNNESRMYYFRCFVKYRKKVGSFIISALNMEAINILIDFCCCCYPVHVLELEVFTLGHRNFFMLLNILLQFSIIWFSMAIWYSIMCHILIFF